MLAQKYLKETRETLHKSPLKAGNILKINAGKRRDLCIVHKSRR